MNICGKTNITCEQAKAYAKSKKADTVFINNASIYWEKCVKVGINPCIAYCQYALETGWGKFGGVLNASFCNPCGLKVTAGGSCTDANAHKKFASWADGIEAHIDHLALYAGVSGYPKAKSKDPRHFSYLFGKVKTVEGLTGNWAMSSTYANNLIKLVKELEGTKSSTSSSSPVTTKKPIVTPKPSEPTSLTGNNFRVKIKTSTLNIRKRASFDSAIVGKVTKNQIFTIMEVSNGLGRLKSGVGWISMNTQYVEKISTTSTTPNNNSSTFRVRIANCSAVNARKGPGNSYAVGQVVKKGTVLTAVSQTADGWVKLKSGLYIYKTFLERI